MRELKLGELEVVAGGFADPNAFSDPFHDPMRNPWETPWGGLGFDDNCPDSVEECKDKVDVLVDSMQDRCRAMDDAGDQRACWEETEQQRASKYRECEALYGD